jgi:hypothetical protein
LSVSAAAAAMLVAWRDQNSITRTDLLNGIGVWAPFKDQLRLEGAALLHAWGLTQQQSETVTPAYLNTMLRASGPLWIHPDGDVARSRVVVAIEGDGTPSSTVRFIHPAVPADGTTTGSPTIQSGSFASFHTALGGGATTIITVDATG